jgi:polyisoprenoid-binding protein YceI
MKIAYAAASLAAALMGSAALAEPAAYEFDRTHTTIKASWNHLGYSTQSLFFTDYEGTLLLDFEEPANSTVDVTFNLADGYWVGANQERFEGHLASDDLFNIAEFPTARFVATGFETEDGETGTMTGDLTLLGVTRPVTLDVTLNQRAPHPFNGTPTAGFDATGVINRTEWGMGYAAPAVSEEIRIDISTELALVQEDEASGS